MDPGLVKTLGEKLLKLQATCSNETEPMQRLPHETILDNVILSYITETFQVPSDRLNKLREITGAAIPIVVASKSNAFWQPVEKPKANNEKSFDFVNLRKKSRQNSKSSDVDQSSIFGSPLKLDIIADLSLCEGDSVLTSHQQAIIDFGLRQPVGKKLVSMYCNLLSLFKNRGDGMKLKEKSTLMVLFDGDNLKSISCMAVEPLLDKQNNYLGTKVSEITSNPSATKSSHMKLHPKFSSSDVLCKARYNILADTEDQLQSDRQETLLLELEWKKAVGKSLIMLHDPPSEAKAEVKIQVMSGNSESPAFSMFLELKILRSIVESLATLQVNWIGTQERPLVDSVKDLVEQLKLGHETVEYRLGETIQGTEYNVGLEMLEDRKDLDFTDHLWKVLQNCTSYSELVDVFRYIITELRKGDLQPFIHLYNATTIGQMVRDSFRGQLREPGLSGRGPLQYLAEMGDQKLMQDYVHVFMSKNLVNIGHLEYYMAGNLSFEDKLTRMEKLQNTLEIVIMLQQYLHLPHVWLSMCCRQVLKHYETHEIDVTQRFTFAVPRANLTNVLERFSPSEWRAEGVKLVDDVPERIVYNFSEEQPFDWVKLAEGSEKRGQNSEEPSLYLTVLRDSVAILC